jgi:hypothetical protein
VSAVRAVLYALAVRMDDRGEAFPSKRQLAADTALGERTVREAIREARRSGWLAVVDHVRPGHAWAFSYYIACIPDSLDLAAVDLGRGVDLAGIAEAWANQHGDITDPLHGLPRPAKSDHAKARTAKGAAAIAARSKRERTEGAAVIAARFEGEALPASEGAANDRMDVRQMTHEGAAAIACNVRPPSPTKFPSKFSEKDLREGRAASDATTHDPEAADEHATEGAIETEAAVPNDGSGPTIAPEVRHGEPQPDPQPLPTPRQPPSRRPTLRSMFEALP